ncbi:hypothetical protein KC717_04915 [Candidatus Dojkabacteria bacterium]|uniref:Uncharacterized protein n=1 Tax=Candidatus Dojkabacteria bacterium TaxID=2099670 RepID=A0A955RKJ8_9BACT|nr:hypothetical protein [Candidatus Dojkabacteria bacterium]
MIQPNKSVKLIVSDVDETIAGVYMPASVRIIDLMNKLLRLNISIMLVSGGGLESIEDRVVNRIDKSLRWRLAVAHCNAIEMWGYDKQGKRKDVPYYSLYNESVTDKEDKVWKMYVQDVIEEFNLDCHKTMPVNDFKEITNHDPHAIMFDDRGPQITLELVNSFSLTSEEKDLLSPAVKSLLQEGADLRVPIIDKLNFLFKEHDLPVHAYKGGEFAINIGIESVSKGTALRYVLKNFSVLKELGIDSEVIDYENSVEIWGDKFSQESGKNDWCMSLELPKDVRSISFREENALEFPKGYNICIWDGNYKLQNGTEEYLESLVIEL